MKLAIEIEDIHSWPNKLRDEAIKNKPLLISYHKKSLQISRLCRENLNARAHPPPNEYKSEYRNLADMLEDILSEHRIVGYHCTRLTDREIKTITDNGLNILSEELVLQRIFNA
jgi:hypothetical protein